MRRLVDPEGGAGHDGHPGPADHRRHVGGDIGAVGRRRPGAHHRQGVAQLVEPQRSTDPQPQRRSPALLHRLAALEVVDLARPLVVGGDHEADPQPLGLSQVALGIAGGQAGGGVGEQAVHARARPPGARAPPPLPARPPARDSRGSPGSEIRTRAARARRSRSSALIRPSAPGSRAAAARRSAGAARRRPRRPPGARRRRDRRRSRPGGAPGRRHAWSNRPL